MGTLSIFFISCLVLGLSIAQKDPHYVGDRDTMVHLFEWKFEDIAKECERFLGPMGYGGVQVSPIQENLIIPKRPWYERYQPISLKIESRSGNEDDFKNMVKRCNKANVRIYVDLIMNHMTGDSDTPRGVGGSIADPSSKSYPAVPFSNVDFHRTCAINNYQNATEVRNCELVGLHDLDQSRENVREAFVRFMNDVIDMGVAGFRLDAAKHMWPEDLAIIYTKLKDLNTDAGFPPNSRPFYYLEVIDFGTEAVKKEEYTCIGRVIEFTYGIVLGNMFRGSEPMKDLKYWGNGWGLAKSEDALVMIDNHDNQRGHGGGGAAILTYKVPRLYKMANAFELAHPYGTVRVMSSFYFNDPSTGPPASENEKIISPEIREDGLCGNGWVCEHRWPQIYQMVVFRNTVIGKPVENWWDNGHNQIAFSRGDRGFIAINNEGRDLKEILKTGLPKGRFCDVISGKVSGGKCTGKTIEVREDGGAVIEIPADDENGVVAIHIGAASAL